MRVALACLLLGGCLMSEEVPGGICSLCDPAQGCDPELGECKDYCDALNVCRDDRECDGVAGCVVASDTLM
jgi:hypothetical protein